MTAALVWFHRWLGIATCLIFAAWFASGAILLFQPFPSLGKVEGAAMGEPLDAAGVAISPARALELAGPGASGLRLVERAGVSAYLTRTAAGTVVIDARTGARLGPIDARQAESVIRAAGLRSARVTGPFAYDQWIVHNQFDALRPFFRIDLDDRAGTQLYVSAITGDVVQRTTSSERAWNWGGAVLHWVYVTPLRSSFTAWDQTVWWLSFVAMLVAVAGTVLGVIRTVAVKRAGRPGLTFFRMKWLRWHHLLGLFASIFVLGWILSGWLSMDHGRLFSRGQPSPTEQALYAGQPLVGALTNFPAAVIDTLPTTKAIGFVSIAGRPLLQVTGVDGQTALFSSRGRPLGDQARDDLLRSALRAAWPGETISAPSVPNQNDLYVLAEGMPRSTVQYRLEKSGTGVYVDTGSGAIVTVMNRSRASYAWIYYALHTFNFPGLSAHPVLRKILVLIPLFFGFLFSITGVVIGYQRLRRSLRQGPTSGATK